MAKHFKVPGYIKLEKFVTVEALEELQRLAYLATAEGSTLRENIQAYIPLESREVRLEAIREMGVAAQTALGRMRG